MTSDHVIAIVLAAGKGTRMKSDMPKVLHPVFFAPMVTHVIDTLEQLRLDKVVVVTGHQHTRVEEALASYDVTFAQQKEQLGTGHAVLSAEPAVDSTHGTVLILCGDTPLVRAETLQQMIEAHKKSSTTVTVMTTVLDNPANYGRVLCDNSGKVLKIVEEKDASTSERQVNEVNAGIYCVDLEFLFSALREIGTDNAQGEVYLTDIVQIACEAKHSVGKFVCTDPLEITGVNSRVELATAHKIMQSRRNQALMLQGITMFDPDTISIEPSVTVGTDTVIYGNCHIAGNTVVGSGCVIEPFVHIKNSVIADGTIVKSFTYTGGGK